MSNKIEFLLAANDQLTPALLLANNALTKFKNGAKDVNGYLDKLGASADGMDKLHGKLSGVGSALMSLGTGAVLGGIAAATAAVFGLSRSITAAGAEQTQTLMSVSDIASGLGVGFNEAQKRVENLKESIADMAAPLPGTTETYTQFFQAVSGGLARTFKGNAAAFEEATTDITKRAGVLAAIWNISGTEAGSVFDRLISGNGGFQEIAQNDVIQRNSNFKAALLQQMAAMGVEKDQWQKASTETRIAIVRKALEIATPDELLNRFNDTFESVTQGLQTFWFNPMKGVFGVMRKVGTDKGITTGLEAVTQVLQSVVSLGQAVMTWGQVRGISIDPMKALVNFLGGVNQLLNGIEYFIRSGGKLPTFNFNFDLATTIRGWAKTLPGVLTSMFRGINGLLSQVDLGEMGTWLADLVNSLSTLMGNLFNKTDWVAIGETIGRLIGSVVRMAINFLATLDYAKLGNVVGGFVLAVVKLGVGIVKGIIVDFGEAIGKYLGEIWEGVRTQFSRLTDALKGVIDRVLGFFSSLNPLQQSSAPATPASAVLGAVGAIANPVGAIGNLTMKAAQGSLDKVSELTGLPNPFSGKPLTKPATNSKKVAYNTYSPNVSITAPGAEQLGSTTLEALAAQYATFTSQMAT